MTTAYRFRSFGGQATTLAVTDGRWHEPDDPIDDFLDLSGLFSVRGLVDAHAHLSADGLDDLQDGDETPDAARRRAFAQLEAGVFCVVDKGGRDGALLHLVTDPPETMPDLEMAGRMLAPPGGYYPGYAREVDVDDLAAEVADAAAGAAWVKLVGDWPKPGIGATPNFDETHLATAVDAAHRAGCKVAIHTAAPRTPSMAVAAGVDSIEHGLFLTDDDLRSLGARSGTWVPTLHAMGRIRDSLRPGGSGQRLFDEGLANAAGLLGVAVDAGVDVLCGTDLAVAHGRVATEAMALAAAGLPGADVLDAVARTGWLAMGRHPSPTVGETADLVAFGGDPREDVSVLAEPRFVMRAGRVLVDRR